MVSFAFLTALCAEVKPLLVAASVGVDLHVQVVGVLKGAVFLGLEQVAGLEDGIKHQAFRVRLLEALLPVLVLAQVGLEVLGQIGAGAGPERRQFLGVVPGCLVDLLNALADHVVDVLAQLVDRIRLVALVKQ